MKIGFIGAGNMGGALAKAAARAGFGSDVFLCDKDTEKAEKLATEIGALAVSTAEIGTCDVIFLGVKPQHLGDALAGVLRFAQNDEPLLVSMAAGVPLSSLEDLSDDRLPIIRIMPNTPVAVGAGVIAYTYNANVTAAHLELFKKILAKAGILVPISESRIDAECAIAGCGPAFVALFAEAMADAGVLCGLSREEAALYARETLFGTAALLSGTGMHPGELKDKVCSPGGSTIEGVRTLEEGSFRATVMNAVIAAFEKTKELGK